MSLLNYKLFYYQRGLRKVNELNRPRISKMEDFKLPKSSIFHYIGDADSLEYGPDLNDVIFNGIKRIVPIYHVTELKEGDLLGNPRKLPGQPQQWIRAFHNKNKRFRKILDINNGVKDINVPFYINYAMIDRRYRYIKNVYHLFHRWHNLETTILSNMNDLANQVDSHQFVFIELPDKLPPLTLLRNASKAMNMSLLKQFDTGNAFMVFEFWKWLGENRKDSILNLIEPKNYSKINFILVDSGAWTVFNMATLNSWRQATEEELKENPNAPKKGFPPKKIQLLFIRYLMSFLLVRSGNVDLIDVIDETIEEAELDQEKREIENNEDIPNTPDETNTEDNENKEVGNSSKPVTNDLPNEIKVTEIKPSVNNKEKNKLESSVQVVDENSIDLEALANEMPEIDQKTGQFILDKSLEEKIRKDLEALDTMTEAIHEKKEENFVSLKANDISVPEEGVMNKANELADEGFMTAAEYRRFQKLGTLYKTIQYPGTNKTLEQMATIDKEKIKIKAPREYKSNRTVFDKSVLKSSLDNFTSQYVNEILDSDIASSILAVQKAGICVTDIEKERVEDITGKYDSLRIKLQPVEGKPSTIWMKVPVVEEDGTIKSGNTLYYLRAQRVDLPIRKTAPNKVVLTSYYGKMTCIRSNKKVTDYGEWLTNNIMSKGLDNDDDSVINLTPGKAFRADVKTPRLYSILSTRFRSFTVGGFHWYLDYKERSNQFTAEEVNEFEKEGSLLVAKNDKGDLLLMDNKSYLYTIKKVGELKQLNPAPSIESMVGLDKLKAPIDIVGAKVLGKIIPIGFILAYYLGLEKLINSLGIQYRRVPAGSQLNLAEDEYRLAFQDESLVFSRDDTVAAMIIAGLKDYHRELKKYSVYEFDKKDVYLNLLEAVGLSSRFLREIDLLKDMFIDPITKEILEEMNEPTTFIGLLTRVVELLQTDEHPDEIDPRYMRIRGYERIAGTIYNELVKSIKAQNARHAKSQMPVEMNPYAVWKAITSDPAMVVVNEINPIKNLKEQEAVTFNGNGGRNGRTMVKHTREYHKNDLGTISEATVDSSDVGVNIFTSYNPNFTSVRGLSKPYEESTDGPANVLSTSFLISPTADTDDKLALCCRRKTPLIAGSLLYTHLLTITPKGSIGLV